MPVGCVRVVSVGSVPSGACAKFGASADGTIEGLGTAMNWLKEFMAVTKYEALKRVEGPLADLHAAHNENVLASFVLWLKRTPSLKTGKPVSAATVCQYTSLIRSHFSSVARHAVVPTSARFLKRTLSLGRNRRDPATSESNPRLLTLSHIKAKPCPKTSCGP